MNVTSTEIIDKKLILVVDDDNVLRDVLTEMIRSSGYTCYSAESAEKALEILKDKKIDVVLTDIEMPGLSGIELVKIVREKYDTDVIVMTAHKESFKYEKIIDFGASDFVYKPMTMQETIIRLKRVLRERTLVMEQRRAHEELKTAHHELKESYLDTIKRLVMAAEYKDENTGVHICRVSRYSALLAKKIGLPTSKAQNIRYASPMHDIGKIGIPDNILLKQGKLTEEEFNVIKTHPKIGAKILDGSNSEILKLARKIAISHHEKWDGSGYPQGLAGDNIPLPSRIVSIADVFDVLMSSRPYKKPLPIDITIEIIKKECGKHFDPLIVDLFLENIEGILSIMKEVESDQKVTIDNFLLD